MSKGNTVTEVVQNPARSAGHLIIAQLEREGVERVYGVPGESFLDILDGLHDSPINAVIGRHEGGVGFMALAEGRLTGRAGVAMVTRGPGAANAFIAVHTAYQDATPLVLFIGLIPVPDRGRESFQEFDVPSWFGSTAKRVYVLDDPASAARVVNEAMFVAASGRPGPVIIGVPEDVIRLSSAGETTRAPLRPVAAAIEAGALERVRTALATAQRPLIVVGGEGWSARSGTDLVRWAARAGIPVAADFRAYDAVPHRLDDPAEEAYVGALGYGRGDYLAALARDADLTVFIGAPRTDVGSDGYTIGQDSATVVITAGELLGHSGRLDEHIVAETNTAIAALTATDLPVRTDRARFDAARAAYRSFSTPRPGNGCAGFADLDAIMLELEALKDDDAVISYGAGNHAVWAGRYLTHRSAASLVAPRNGAMGVGIPAAVAAGLVFPGREVISVAGDGCFLMNGQEIATAFGYGVPFIAIVVDNGCFATIREHQENHYPGRPSGTHLSNPDFAALARAYHGHGETVSDARQFADAFRRARESGTAAIIHVIQDPTVRAPRASEDLA